MKFYFIIYLRRDCDSISKSSLHSSVNKDWDWDCWIELQFCPSELLSDELNLISGLLFLLLLLLLLLLLANSHSFFSSSSSSGRLCLNISFLKISQVVAGLGCMYPNPPPFPFRHTQVATNNATFFLAAMSSPSSNFFATAATSLRFTAVCLYEIY